MPWCGFNNDMAAGLALFARGLNAQKERSTTMPLCGWNATMTAGLEKFSGGLAIQTDKRAAEEGVPLRDIPGIELAELDMMAASLEASPKRIELEGVLGLTLYVRHLYREFAKQVAAEPSISAKGGFDAATANISATMFAMEDHYYQNLRPNNPHLQAIALITEFLESRLQAK